MKINSLGYSIKQGLQNIVRNKFFSLASIATMIVCVLLFGTFYAIIVNFDHMVKNAEEGVAITVFFEKDLSDEQITMIGDQIRSKEEVADVVYVSAEEAWETYKNQYFAEDPSLADGFKEDNPLADSANYQVYMKDVEKQQQLVDELRATEGVRKVNSNQVAADTLSDFNRLLSYVTVGLIILLLAVAVFLIGNTINVGITVRREEIGIMKLIGATDMFVKAPFVFEGVIIGLAGAIIPLILLYVLYSQVVRFVMEKFQLLTGIISFLPAGEVFRVLVPVSICIGVGIGLIGGLFTTHKHLKV